MPGNDLKERLQLVSGAMLACPPPDAGYLPRGYEAAHNIGRWWEGALLLEETVGLSIPSLMEQAMAINIRALTASPYGLLLNDPEIFGGGALNLHNLREGLLALTSLIHYRRSRWAVYKGRQLLETMKRLFHDHTLTLEDICRETGTEISGDPMITPGLEDPYRLEDRTPTDGRALEGILRFYQETGDDLALELLHATAAFHLEHTLRPDGSPPPWLADERHVGHNHSYLGTLRGLLLYGIHFQREEYIQRVYRTYTHSLFRINCTHSGFAPHDLGALRFPDEKGDPFGDHASCADVAYLAFLLAVYGGHPELLDDAQRLIRGRLFYSQITQGEGEALGAWGTYGGYFGQGVIMDVYACIASTLCRIEKDLIRSEPESITLYLLFSAQSRDVDVQVDYGEDARILLTPKRRAVLRVHLPAWCTGPEVLTADGQPLSWYREEGFLILARDELELGKSIQIRFPLPVRQTEETTWRSGRRWRITWKGDEILTAEEEAG